MGFLEDYEAVSTSDKPDGDKALAQIALLLEAVVQTPSEFFAELREKQPVFVTPFGTVVTHYRDVVEVIDCHDIFGVAPFATAMIRNNDGLNFILGMEDGPEFERELSLLRTSVRQSDLEAIRTFVAGAAGAVIEAARPSGRLELAEGYAHLVPSQMASWYFGVPIDDVQKQMHWTRSIFTDIFLNLTADPAITATAATAGQEFRAHVDAAIAAEHAGTNANPVSPVFEHNVLKRFVAAQQGSDDAFTDREIQNNLIGCITGVADNTVAAVVNTINVLLDRPDDLAGAVKAAVSGDDATVSRYVWEALRLHTPAPFLLRVSTAAHTLARGTDRETVLPAGSIVFAANGSAMMDATELDEPDVIKLDRPAHHYMHFGWGLHECLGKHISGVQLPQLVKAVLTLPGLRRASGDDAQPQYEGSFARRFVVEFDPS